MHEVLFLEPLKSAALERPVIHPLDPGPRARLAQHCRHHGKRPVPLHLGNVPHRLAHGLDALLHLVGGLGVGHVEVDVGPAHRHALFGDRDAVAVGVAFPHDQAKDLDALAPHKDEFHRDQAHVGHAHVVGHDLQLHHQLVAERAILHAVGGDARPVRRASLLQRENVLGRHVVLVHLQKVVRHIVQLVAVELVVALHHLHEVDQDAPFHLDVAQKIVPQRRRRQLLFLVLAVAPLQPRESHELVLDAQLGRPVEYVVEIKAKDVVAGENVGVHAPHQVAPLDQHLGLGLALDHLDALDGLAGAERYHVLVKALARAVLVQGGSDLNDGVAGQGRKSDAHQGLNHISHAHFSFSRSLPSPRSLPNPLALDRRDHVVNRERQTLPHRRLFEPPFRDDAREPVLRALLVLVAQIKRVLHGGYQRGLFVVVGQSALFQRVPQVVDLRGHVAIRLDRHRELAARAGALDIKGRHDKGRRVVARKRAQALERALDVDLAVAL